ncbi:hypothetical protein GPL17_27685 [Bradyrhizobium yuanmingense]|uniref:hypothetical protein n=1 Tax=Bradyrhizobium yuanmingense TaxID=108015 RepID=UPI0012F86D37|nr:hypothetical protein [Bradyrhizobium yuanmingense]MVT54242.1 hypothetical protein [Bradyrhizobium yuanmingense]
MAKSQYSGDSPSLSLFSVQPGMSGSPEIILAKHTSFLAMRAMGASSAPASYVMNATTYAGESVDYARRLRDHRALKATLRTGRVLPSTTSTSH